MPKQRQMFSESWHRVADLVATLSPSVETHRQFFRGRLWYVLRDPLNNEFFRISPAAWAFVGRLNGKRTVAEAWRQCMEIDPDQAPGQEEVIQVLSQLHLSNLLHSSFTPDSARIFEHYRKMEQQKTLSAVSNFLFFRIPLIDPNRLLTALLPVAKLVISRAGAVVWFLVIVAALKLVADNFDAVLSQGAGVIAPKNLMFLYLCGLGVKLCHEFGHGIICRRFGGEVHTLGVMLMVFTPFPYVDATSAWSFRTRKQRLLVSAGGMAIELFIAAIATFVWAYTAPGLLHRLAYNVMFIASVSTILFNANPLLRFDGYYIFSDLMDIPNLYKRSSDQLKYYILHWVYGCDAVESQARSMRDAFWLTVYGIGSTLYRVMLTAWIIIMVAERFFEIGIVVALFCAALYFLKPIGHWFVYLATNPALTRVRRRAILSSAIAVAGLLLSLGLIPVPSSFRAPGVVQAAHFVNEYNRAQGFLETILVESGAYVTKGQPVAQLRNDDLGMKIDGLTVRIRQIQSHQRDARQRNQRTLIKPLNSELETAQHLLSQIIEREKQLTVRASMDGIWFSPGINHAYGAWLPRGSQLGQIVDNSNFRFVAVVSQKDAATLFAEDIVEQTVRLSGRGGTSLKTANLQRIQSDQDTLPTPALGWMAGGAVETDMQDPASLRTAESFFSVRVDLLPEADMPLYHLQSGQLRFALRPEPLLQQWSRALRKLIQERIQI